MPNVIDSYSETNYDGVDYDVGASFNAGVGTEFSGNGATLGSSKFYMEKHGSPTGNAVSKIYNASSGIPSGAALATSDNLDVSTLTTSNQLVEFTFSGANQIALSSGTNNYFVSCEYSGGDASDYISCGAFSSGP